MPKIEEVLKRSNRHQLAPLQKKVMAQLEKRKGEVFGSADPTLATLFPDNAKSAIDWSLWALQKKGLIGKLRVPGDRTYFGSLEAIEELGRRLDRRNGSTETE